MQIILQELLSHFTTSVFLSWQSSFGQGCGKAVCFPLFIYIYYHLVLSCPLPTLKGKGRLSGIIRILWCIVLEEKVENPPGVQEKEDSSNKLLVLVKPPFIKLLDRALVFMCLIWRKSVRAQNKPLFKNAGHGKERMSKE